MTNKKKHHYIYKVTHKKSKKIYIGIHSTDNMEDRYFANGVYEAPKKSKNEWTKLNRGIEKNNLHMKNALVKYGRKAFKREIIEVCNSREELIEREAELVDKDFIERNDTYNHRTGGYANTEFSEAVRKKISENNPMHKEENRKKVSKAVKESWTEERRKDASKNNAMKRPEISEKLSGENSVWYGRKHSEESIAKMRKSAKNKKVSIETRNKKSESMKNVMKDKIVILDKQTNRKFHSLEEVRQFLIKTENFSRSLGTLSLIIRGKRENPKIGGRFIYEKNYYDRPEAKIFLRGDIWQMSIWIPKEKKHFKKSLKTQSHSEALKIAKQEEEAFYKKNKE